MLSNHVQQIFNQLNGYTKNYQLSICKKSYKKMEESFKNYLGSWEGFSSAINVSFAFMVADGNASYNEYDLFLQITGFSPSYEEFRSNAIQISKNYDEVIRLVCNYGHKHAADVIYFALAFYALRGTNLSSYEENLINAIERRFA